MQFALIACLCAILTLADGEPTEPPKAILVLKPHEDTARCIAFSPDGTTLATGDHDSVVRLWNLPEGREIATLKGHAGKLGSIAFSPDGRLLASVGVDGVRI
jgi:WD40 repeat protein